jgi:multiple sugar transport system permease protein
MNKAVTSSRGTSRRSHLLMHEASDGWIFASPFILGFFLWWVYPMAYSIYLVFQDWDIISPPKFAGVSNLVELFRDPKVALSLYNTAFYTFLGVPIQVTVALLLALALNVPFRGVAFYRTIFYLPSVTPAVAAAVVWFQIFNADFGMLNSILALLALPPVRWLNDPVAAKPAFILMSIWTIGGQVVIFLAGLQSVPVMLVEAARIDGAGVWSCFRHVTLPLLSPVVFFNLVVGIIGSFQVFTSAYIMTRGGPQDATLFTVLYLFQNGFQFFRMGYAATLGWMLFCLIIVFTIIQFRLADRWVHYEA